MVVAEKIPPYYVDTPYSLRPDKRGERGYALVLNTMRFADDVLPMLEPYLPKLATGKPTGAHACDIVLREAPSARRLTAEVSRK
ncbi:ATP-dependent DNA helicase [Cupriavidus basilensis OR16]|uniref:ATP-dependent DNA helicase n=1 Tax=Cupriavidus basilensis OR16 TaxID=1127483 RepID=H1RZQ3_9BURK|nr:ATP-dependent DNA helicase [Cupriavidus basilensis OR16]